MLMLPIALIGLALLTAACAEAGASSGGAGDGLAEGIRIGSKAPDFALSDLDGKEVRLSDFRGRPVMLNFWATWCGPCRVEMPHMQEAQRELGEKTGFVVLAVNLGEDAKTARRFLEENGFEFTAVLDRDSSVARDRYKIIGLPTSFFIDREGVIRDIQVGPLATKEHLMSKLKSAL
ncbi:MAG: cytochrome biosis protein [Dehalococcoidia bacterium]|nr:cytochrome biosis protein [Dehalococcoidia bacterium]